jgi:hypothetical protein
MHSVLPVHILPGSLSEVLLLWLMEKKVEFVWETDMLHNVHIQWAMLCTKVLICTNAPAGCMSALTHLYVFWSICGTS